MVRDADEHVEDDKLRRSAVESRNRLDSLVYSTEKTFEEHKEKLDDAGRERLSSALEEAKKALDGEDAAAMDAAAATLTEASHALAEKMYQQPPADGGEGDAGGSGSGQAGDDEVIDAEYVDVEESTG